LSITPLKIARLFLTFPRIVRVKRIHSSGFDPENIHMCNGAYRKPPVILKRQDINLKTI
jgi:hypothetical protein